MGTREKFQIAHFCFLVGLVIVVLIGSAQYFKRVGKYKSSNCILMTTTEEWDEHDEGELEEYWEVRVCQFVDPDATIERNNNTCCYLAEDTIFVGPGHGSFKGAVVIGLILLILLAIFNGLYLYKCFKDENFLESDPEGKKHFWVNIFLFMLISINFCLLFPSMMFNYKKDCLEDPNSHKDEDDGKYDAIYLPVGLAIMLYGFMLAFHLVFYWLASTRHCCCLNPQYTCFGYSIFVAVVTSSFLFRSGKISLIMGLLYLGVAIFTLLIAERFLRKYKYQEPAKRTPPAIPMVQLSHEHQLLVLQPPPQPAANNAKEVETPQFIPIPPAPVPGAQPSVPYGARTAPYVQSPQQTKY
eukprot:TRINITY_DN35601_c0_g1_i1.p1 TRINITY_DN35601_c0_g1~~TRINITY_DN35601_c0_g1_i1.p1  ORF type:complete len:355 (+),score=42.81 TRINITY_DN35601_c0_g1_i1:2-1066(+)